MEKSDVQKESDESDDNECEEKTKNKEENIPAEAENYLKSVSGFISQSYDPKLKREEQKLNDLLKSYRKLCSDLAEKCNLGQKCEESLSRIPEIYAILHPELYKDVRDAEKQKLIEKLSRKQFFERQLEQAASGKTTPAPNLYDLRQKEKERFTRLVASAPSAIHNILPAERPLRLRRRLLSERPREVRVEENPREKEKERLARILSTTPSRKRASSKNTSRRIQEVNKENTGRLSSTKEEQKTTRSQLGRPPGQQSKVEGKQNQEVRKVARSKEKNVSPVKDSCEMDTPRTCSASTQTENFFELDCVTDGPKDHSAQVENKEEINLVTHPPSLGRIMYPHLEITPKEKLIMDLHGTSPITNQYDQYLVKKDELKEHKYKQMAYAEELRKQIEEKKRLEEEKKRREKEEEEMIEKKFKEQQERLQMEYSREQNQRLGWLQQRAEQEGLVRQRLLEMELEAEEFKRRERSKKRGENLDLPISQGIPGRFSQRVQVAALFFSVENEHLKS